MSERRHIVSLSLEVQGATLADLREQAVEKAEAFFPTPAVIRYGDMRVSATAVDAVGVPVAYEATLDAWVSTVQP